MFSQYMALLQQLVHINMLGTTDSVMLGDFVLKMEEICK